MKYLFYALLALAALVGLTLLAQQDPGYVYMVHGKQVIETSVSFLLLLILASFAVLYFLIRLAVRFIHMPGAMKRWRRQRRLQRAARLTTRGLIHLAEGHWAQAERALRRGARYSESPLINYLSAARAAQKQGADDRRDQYLADAHNSMPDAELAVGLTQAEVQLSHGQLEQALATLSKLRSSAPKHAQVIYMLKRLNERLESWDELVKLLPELRRSKVMPDEELQQLEFRAYSNYMNSLGEQGDWQALQDLWKTLPREYKQDARLLANYARNAMQMREAAQVEPLLRDALKKHRDESLVDLFGQLQGDSEQQLNLVEQWLKAEEQNPHLLLAAGRLAMRRQLWGKARNYLEAAIGIQPSAGAYAELGQLLEQLDEAEAAAECFRKGLFLGV